MPDNTVLQGNAPNNASGNAPSSSPRGATTEYPSQEAKLRQALELMGGRRAGSAAAPQASAGARNTASPASTRHRYVRDGEVPVVHAALGRPTHRSDPANQQDKALLDSLRQELDRERAGRDAAERTIAELRLTSTALQTRLAHLEMDLQASQEALLEAVQAATQSHQSEAVAPPKPGRPRGKRPAEPEPVKWWIKSEKS